MAWGAVRGQTNRNGDGGMIWKRSHDSVEEFLLDARPEAPESLVRELDRNVVSPATRPARRSRRALYAAMTVVMVGTFASFGGLGYAASGAQGTVNAVKQAVAPAKTQVTQSAKTSAAAQYDEESVPTEQSKTEPGTLEPPTSTAATATASTGKGTTLPFTGLGLGATAFFGAALLAFGIYLRRRESRN